MKLVVATLFALMLALGAQPVSAASEDVACVQRFLIDAGYEEVGAPDGAIGRKTIAAGSSFRDRFKLDNLPELSADTAATWCAFATSPRAIEIKQISRYRLYAITLEAVEPVDPFAFDFSKYEAAGFDAFHCVFNIFRTDRGSGAVDSSPMVAGEVDLVESRITFTKAFWYTGGLANGGSFQTSRLAFARGPQLVGKVELFHQWVDRGQVPVPAELVTINKSHFEPGERDVPEGRYTFVINAQHEGVLELRSCRAY